MILLFHYHTQGYLSWCRKRGAGGREEVEENCLFLPSTRAYLIFIFPRGTGLCSLTIGVVHLWLWGALIYSVNAITEMVVFDLGPGYSQKWLSNFCLPFVRCLLNLTHQLMHVNRAASSPWGAPWWHHKQGVNWTSASLTSCWALSCVAPYTQPCAMLLSGKVPGT